MPKGMSLDHIIRRNKNLTEKEKKHLIEKYSNYKTPQIRSCFEPICVAMKPIEKTFLNNEIKYNTGLLDMGPKTRVGYQKCTRSESSPNNAPHSPISDYTASGAGLGGFTSPWRSQFADILLKSMKKSIDLRFIQVELGMKSIENI